MSSRFDTRQSVNRAALPMVGSSAGDSLDTILAKVDPEIAKLYEDRNITLTQGGIITFTGTSLQPSEALKLEINSQIAGGAPTIIDLGATARAFSADGRMLYAVINRTGGTATVTADAATLPAVTSANSEVFLIAKRRDAGDGTKRVYIMNSGAMDEGQTSRLGASGSGSSSGAAISPAGGFQATKFDFFTGTASGDTKIDGTKTNAARNAAQTLYAISCDKSKTVATSSGTAFTINTAPGFTVVAGDIVYITSGARAGQWRRIASLSSQIAYTLDIAFTGGNATAGDTLMVSQAVWTSDLVNDGDAAQKTRPRDFFPSTSIPSINVDYHDSLTAADGVADFVDTARMVVSASNSGVQADTGTPTSDTFAPIFTRVAAPGQLLDYSLLNNATKERLFLVFFANPANGSVTTLANLVDFQVSFYPLTSITSGGYLNSAYCFSDGSGTPSNCTAPTVVATKTRITLTFSYVPGLNLGTVAGDMEVIVDGQVIPRFLSGATLDAYYTEVAGSTNQIDLWADLSIYQRSIEVVRRQGTIDTSSTNTAVIGGLQEIIVGTAAQVAAGQAGYSSLQSALNTLSSGGLIKVIGTPIAENITLANSNVAIEGKGRFTQVTGTLTINSGANFCLVKGLRITDNVNMNGNRSYMREIWLASGKTLTIGGGTLGNDAEYMPE